MGNLLTKLYVKLQILKADQGQDLIEYALVATLIALAATAGMGAVAGGIQTAFTNIAAQLPAAP